MQVYRKGRWKYDLAYGCFLLGGTSALAVGVVSAVPMDSATAGVLGILVGVPLVLASLWIMMMGILLSILLWRHWPLLLLSALTVLFVLAVVLEVEPVLLYDAAPFLYGFGTLATCSFWFLVLRGKALPEPGSE